ncbi:unnamed protein product [Sphagnum jensenii]|uniref:Pentatricopeptide repeat-containing protein n=1 Tax=Sphagnum jensenii TaxID=128206 RepID=A0ABP0W9J0_9BRYO
MFLSSRGFSNSMWQRMQRFDVVIFFKNSDRCHRAIASWDGVVQATTTGHIEKFWLDFLSDPSALWNHHLSEKVSPKYLDFKHKKKTHEAFWRWKPPWVEAAEMTTYKSLLQKCTYNKNLAEGRNVHLHIIESGVKPSTSLSNAILNMYCKCGSLVEAQKVFDAIPEKDIITWTLMLVAYASHGLNGEGFKLYKQVCDEGIRCDRIMYTSIVSICASLGDLEKAKAVHNDIIKSGIGTDAILENNLVHMYARCGSMELAHDVFHKMVERNVVSWNAMIAGSAQNGNAEETCHLFQQMQQESIQPDHITFMSLLNACTSPATYKQGCWVHANILNTGWDADVRVGTALVSMFAKCGKIHDARQVFDKMKVRDVISWTAMINGYADHGPYGKAMELFREMEQFGVAPNTVTFIGLLKACANQASLQEARWVHASIVAAALESDLRVRNGLIDMYAKCGSLEDAFSIFSTMSEKDVVTWSAMIAGCGQHGHGRAALEHFDQMVSEGVHPNSVTFVGVLSACSHAGLVVEGLRCFHLMVKDYGISPALDHFGCVVDLLGRAGHLHEAEDFLNKMPQTPGASTWGPLLSACRIHGNVQLAEPSGTNFNIVTFNQENSLVHNVFKT